MMGNETGPPNANEIPSMVPAISCSTMPGMAIFMEVVCIMYAVNMAFSISATSSSDLISRCFTTALINFTEAPVLISLFDFPSNPASSMVVSPR
jgi:hypothetical protein